MTQRRPLNVGIDTTDLPKRVCILTDDKCGGPRRIALLRDTRYATQRHTHTNTKIHTRTGCSYFTSPGEMSSVASGPRIELRDEWASSCEPKGWKKTKKKKKREKRRKKGRNDARPLEFNGRARSAIFVRRVGLELHCSSLERNVNGGRKKS